MEFFRDIFWGELSNYFDSTMNNVIIALTCYFAFSLLYAIRLYQAQTPLAKEYPLRTEFQTSEFDTDDRKRTLIFTAIYFVNLFSLPTFILNIIPTQILSLAILPGIFIQGMRSAGLGKDNPSMFLGLSQLVFSILIGLAIAFSVWAFYITFIRPILIYADLRRDRTERGRPTTLKDLHLRFDNERKGLPPTRIQAQQIKTALNEIKERAEERGQPYTHPEYIYVTKDANINAYVGARSLFITEQLMSQPQILKPILAHEIGHLVCKHGFFNQAIASFPIIALADLIERKKEESEDWLTKILIVYSLVTAWVVDFFFKWISREDEYDADAYAVALGYGKGLANALTLFLTHGDNLSITLSKRTHPYTQDRIIRIEQALNISAVTAQPINPDVFTDISRFKFPTVLGFGSYGAISPDQAQKYMTGTLTDEERGKIDELFPLDPIYPKSQEYTRPEAIDYWKPFRVLLQGTTKTIEVMLLLIAYTILGVARTGLIPLLILGAETFSNKVKALITLLLLSLGAFIFYYNSPAVYILCILIGLAIILNEVNEDYKNLPKSLSEFNNFIKQDENSTNIFIVGAITLALMFSLSYLITPIQTWSTQTKKDIDKSIAAYMATATPTPDPKITPTTTHTPIPTPTPDLRKIAKGLPTRININGVSYEVREPFSDSQLKACEEYTPCAVIEAFETSGSFSDATKTFCIATLIVEKNNEFSIRHSLIAQLKSNGTYTRDKRSDNSEERRTLYSRFNCPIKFDDNEQIIPKSINTPTPTLQITQTPAPTPTNFVATPIKPQATYDPNINSAPIPPSNQIPRLINLGGITYPTDPPKTAAEKEACGQIDLCAIVASYEALNRTPDNKIAYCIVTIEKLQETNRLSIQPRIVVKERLGLGGFIEKFTKLDKRADHQSYEALRCLYEAEYDKQLAFYKD